MENLYIDESGSMTCEYCDKIPYFVIAIIRVKNKDKLKRVYKRFISKNIERLRELDTTNKMFTNNTFIELKGSCFDYQMKNKFIEYFCKNNYFEIFYIRIENKRITTLYKNTARAFNYVFEKFFENMLI